MHRLLFLTLILLLGGCCYLNVETDPSDAMVAINDVYVGKSPVKNARIWFWETFSAKHITATRDGYFPGEADIGFWEVFFWVWGTAKDRSIHLKPMKAVADAKVSTPPVNATE